MMKKTMSLVLAVMLLFSLTLPAMAAGAEFVVTLPEYAPKAGESFHVTLALKNNPGFNAFKFTLTYDTEKMECTKVAGGALAEQTLYVTNPDGPYGGALISGATVNAVTEDGVMAVFHFTAKKDLSSNEFGTNDIGIGNEEGEWLPVSVTGLEGMKSDSGNDSEPVSEAVAKPSFPDIAGHWGEEYIVKSAELGLFKGYGDGRFGPNDKVTRAQFVTVLYRMDGSPDAAPETPFTDIGDQIPEFRTAIAWAFSNGYVNGKTDTTFDPSGDITRQEALLILFRYNGGRSGAERMFTGIYDTNYTDSGDIASWAKDAMYWGVYHEIISGTSKTTLSPQGTATRAELAKILVGYLDKFSD